MKDTEKKKGKGKDKFKEKKDIKEEKKIETTPIETSKVEPDITTETRIRKTSDPVNNISNELIDNISTTSKRWAPVLKVAILALIATLAFCVRIFSVIRYESIIHEFDPWFNFRSTKYLTKEGIYKFWNWFDSESWYPLGRNVGGTIYPGLMVTAYFMHWLSNALSFPIDIREICVFLAPIFSGLCAIATYLYTKEVSGRSEAGLFAALFISIVPSYISRSVAGSYDNEGVAIFALVITFYLFIKSVNTGSIMWSIIASLSYFYMVAAWGGYNFIINVIAIYVLGMIFIGRFSNRLYIAYTVFYCLGTLLAAQIPFVGYGVARSSEHLASHGVFMVTQVYMFISWVKKHLSEQRYKEFGQIILTLAYTGFFFIFLFLTVKGATKWTGRSLTLLDPTYAKKHMPIVASVSEHQPTSWGTFFFDLHYLIVFMPLGLFFCFTKLSDGKLFTALYGVLSVYFACVMIRLMLVIAPVACVLTGIGISKVLHKFAKGFRAYFRNTVPPKENIVAGKRVKKEIIGKKDKVENKVRSRVTIETAVAVFLFIGSILSHYIYHSTWAAAEAYSSPSVVLASRGRDGSRVIIDDYREAYNWLRQNTRQEDKIMSWWDYGYQITGMANRTVLVDNNTWNHTHIAMVGRAMASTEEEAYEIAKQLDVDYVLVIFGGLSYYSGDDISKFLWMVRISGGVFPQIKEPNYLANGNYRIDEHVTDTMKNCLMYKLCYYRFDEVTTSWGKPPGFDTVRNVVIGHKGFKLKYFSEAFSSERWIVRIYKVNASANREPGIKSRYKLAKSPTLKPKFKKLTEVF